MTYHLDLNVYSAFVKQETSGDLSGDSENDLLR